MARHKDTGKHCLLLLCVIEYFCHNIVTIIVDDKVDTFICMCMYQTCQQQGHTEITYMYRMPVQQNLSGL